MVDQDAKGTLRRHLRLPFLLLQRSGEWLLYLFFAMPFAVDQRLALISLVTPQQAELFGTVWPFYSAIEFSAALIALGLYLCRTRDVVVRHKILFVYATVNVLAIVSLPFVTPAGEPLYWDYALEFLRLISVAACASSVLAGRRYEPTVLVRCILIVLTETVIFLIAINPVAFLADRGGRVNGPGLEITSTGHVGALAVLLGTSLRLPRRYRYSLIFLGGVVLLLSGSRIPFLTSVLILIFFNWKRASSFRKRIVVLGAVGAFVVCAILLASATSIGGSNLGTFLAGSSELQAEYSLGRGVALLSAVKLILDHPFGYADSDWAIQARLVRYGFPSHTHSHLLQSYLRYGPSMIAFWGLLIWQTIDGIRKRSPYSQSLCFILIGSALDYYGFVTKAMVLVFMIAVLNEAYIETTDFPAARFKLARGAVEA